MPELLTDEANENVPQATETPTVQKHSGLGDEQQTEERPTVVEMPKVRQILGVFIFFRSPCQQRLHQQIRMMHLQGTASWSMVRQYVALVVPGNPASFDFFSDTIFWILSDTMF